jgi:hypothetical protein
LPRRRVHSSLALALAAALASAAAGCAGMGDPGSVFENSDRLFSKPFVEAPEWAKSNNAKTAPLGPSGPVTPEDLVDAGGRCAPETARAQAVAEPAPAPAAAAAEPAAPRANPAYGSVAGDLASAPMPQGPPPAPMPASVKPSDRLQIQPGAGAAPVMGGIALGMTECQAVRRAGQPSHVAVGAGDRGARKVVLTYLSGPWPGIYTFDSGRLKEIAAAPVPEKPAKPAAKKRLKKKPVPKTATTERVYVQ